MALIGLSHRVRTRARGAAGALLVAVLLSACAGAPPQAEPAAEVEPPRPAPESPVVAPAGEPEPAVAGRHTFRFDTLSVALSESEKARVVTLAEQVRGARAVVVRGSCDRNAVGNAREAAIARALAVRHVLVENGVPAAKIRTRYSTEDGTHAVVLRVN